MNTRLTQIGKDNFVTVHIRDLIDGFRHGIVNHQAEIEKSPERQELLSQRTGMWLSNIDKTEVSKALRAHVNKENT